MQRKQQQLHQCSTTIMEEKTHLLEINLISAQGLKPPSTAHRRMQTYAVAWVDPSLKLRTRIDQLGSENPTWNDKFIFRVPSDFFTHDTSAISIEIYAVRYLRDILIGTVRFLVGNSISGANGLVSTNPSFSALQIRRPSGRFHGVLNIGANLIKGSDFAALNGASAIGYRDLMGFENGRQNQKKRRNPKLQKGEQIVNGGNPKSLDDLRSSGGSGDYSSDADSNQSTCSSSTSTASSSAFKDWSWNGFRDKAGRRGRSDVLGLLCGLGFQRKIHLSPSDQNLQNLAEEK